jgi:hypothetical protein
LKRQAAERGVNLQVEKLDVTDAGDRKKALMWDVEILPRNVIAEGETPQLQSADPRAIG